MNKAKNEIPKNAGLKDVEYFEDKIERDRRNGFDTSKIEKQLKLLKETLVKRLREIFDEKIK